MCSKNSFVVQCCWDNPMSDKICQFLDSSLPKVCMYVILFGMTFLIAMQHVQKNAIWQKNLLLSNFVTSKCLKNSAAAMERYRMTSQVRVEIVPPIVQHIYFYQDSSLSRHKHSFYLVGIGILIEHFLARICSLKIMANEKNDKYKSYFPNWLTKALMEHLLQAVY